MWMDRWFIDVDKGMKKGMDIDKFEKDIVKNKYQIWRRCFYFDYCQWRIQRRAGVGRNTIAVETIAHEADIWDNCVGMYFDP